MHAPPASVARHGAARCGFYSVSLATIFPEHLVTVSDATLRAALHTASRRLGTVSETPRVDAEWLLSLATGLTRGQIRAREEATLDRTAARRFDALVARRAQGEPIAYILGEWEFWSLPLTVSPAVLIPRPETELLVECALRYLPTHTPAEVLDLGTGSGAVAIALAVERPLARITAVDRSAAALEIAAHNVARHALGRIELRESDWFARLAGRRFDVIVANPPYVAVDDPALEASVALYEPATALLAGVAGLDAIEALVAGAPSHLLAGGALLLEHGAAQGPAVRKLFECAGFERVATARDLAGHERITVATLADQ
jgi:release factor glutamine methyltransferase